MRLIIRITRTTISFTAPNTVIEGQTDFEQYSMKTGISVAANMRQALADCRLLQVHTSPTQNGQTMPSQYHPVFSQVRVYVDTPLLLIPAEEFDADAAPLLYHHVNTTCENDASTPYRFLPPMSWQHSPWARTCASCSRSVSCT